MKKLKLRTLTMIANGQVGGLTYRKKTNTGSACPSTQLVGKIRDRYIKFFENSQLTPMPMERSLE